MRPSFAVSRLVAAAGDPDEILRFLAHAAVGQSGASAAAVLKVTPEGVARLAASEGALRVEQFTVEPDELDSRLGELMQASGKHSEQAQPPSCPMATLFGALGPDRPS